MRKIETEMLQAIHDRKDWQKDNTQVVTSTDGSSAMVYLHGNFIAMVTGLDTTDAKVQASESTWSKYPTMTTGSRLHALGIHNKADRGSGHSYCELDPVPLRPLNHLDFMGRF